MQMTHDTELTALDTDTETGRWRAFEARDRGADGAFVVAVRTTGIYCRPSCPARRPRRENVAFYTDPERAEAAGFRACLRCRPREVAAQAQLVQQVCAHIDAHLDESVTLAELSAATGVSPHHLQRTFKRALGVSPRAYAEARRLETFRARLKQDNGQVSVTDALYDAGYGSSSRLYERAPAQLGMTPSAYRRGGAGRRIGYSSAPCALGQLLVAATERGVCLVSLADSDAELLATLEREFPAAELTRDDGPLGADLRAIIQYLAGERQELDLPVDVRATAFQWRVWEALQTIPYGATRSYGDVARAIGQPRAVRAVAQACASNPVALVIPCHRVVRAGGQLGGYRWGVQRKQALLDREREHELATA
jgi:AraC family transcriptional regulator, regulatory protein of adaptative response / methylated-DNA-[protein]-cysteine methyltransferase